MAAFAKDSHHKEHKERMHLREPKLTVLRRGRKEEKTEVRYKFGFSSVRNLIKTFSSFFLMKTI